METVFTIIIAAVAAVVAALMVFFAMKARQSAAMASKETQLRMALESVESIKADSQARLAEQKSEAERRLADQKAESDLRIKELKESQKEALENARKLFEAENDKVLKAREESLRAEAEETMKKATVGINQNFAQMKEAFEQQKKSHAEEISSIKTQFEQTARHLGEQSERIGTRAEKLADALRHDNKMQGNWGEMQLQNIFDQEGLVKGRDYEREEYLRDETGDIVENEDSGKRMRPDFILHFPDDTDVIVDSKMNIDAYVDWYNAETQEQKDAAAKRNLEALKAQIKSLSGKDYSKYVTSGRRTLPFVVMYVSNYGALALAKQFEPSIENDAFRVKVLITTEATIMPFLRLIHTAWITVDQVKNQEKIVKAATQMVDRVADLCMANKAVGDALAKAVDSHNKCSAKLAEGGQSITNAAREVIRLGVPANPKKRPALGVDDSVLISDTENEDSLS